MSRVQCLLVATAVVATTVLVAAKPFDFAFLSDVANKTMCPIKVVIDDNPERIPRRIKFLKCDENPNRLCLEHQITHGCCKRHHHKYTTQCVEIYDWVQVQFNDVPTSLKVPVGCTCTIQETTTAKDIS